MPRKPLTTPEQVFTLKELLNGRSPEFVAAALGRPTVEITAWAHDHGHPDTGRMRQHLKRAETTLATTGQADPAPAAGRRVVDEPARRTTPVPRPDLSRAHTAPAHTPPPAVTAVATGANHDAPTVPTAAADPFDDLDDLYFRATTPKAKRAAQRARDAIATLTAQVTADEAAAAAKARAEQEKAAEKARAEAEKAAAKAEIARLEAQLAEARRAAETTKRRSPSTTYHPTLPAGTTTADVRAWARENGHQVAQRGLLPQALVDAYAAAVARPETTHTTTEAGAA